MPKKQKFFVCQVVAYLIYFPLARAAFLLERMGLDVGNWPLSVYRNKSLYTMRTDALDRFGTKLEHRFSRVEIENMLTAAGLENIQFSMHEPYHCAVGFKK